ncbi:MAG: sigma-70 family RNA polymerase sigma factor [Chitinophagaceae bacterium]
MILQEEEIQLTAQLVRGDIAAFDTLYHQYHHAVFANILQYVHQPDIAEDILQEVFLRLWENRHSFNNTVGGWLFTVSHNESLSYLKKTLSEKKVLSALPAEDHEELDETLYQSRIELLNEAINTLPPFKKEVFQLCKLEGKTYNEAAALLDTSPAIIKERLRSASKLVRTYLVTRYPAMQLTTSLIILLY